MKNVKLLLLTAFGACILQACQGIKNGDDKDDDTANISTDTLKRAIIPIGKEDIKFVTDVNAACEAEIKVGSLAKLNGRDKRIKNFGVMMVKDLTKGKSRLAMLAKAKKITLADTVTNADQKEISDLSKKSGKDFDMAYLIKAKADYERAFNLFQYAAKHADDKDIKGFATKNVLTIKRHLDAIDAIHSSIK